MQRVRQAAWLVDAVYKVSRGNRVTSIRQLSDGIEALAGSGRLFQAQRIQEASKKMNENKEEN